MSTLLPFHKSILENIHDPSTSELILIARGLGLRRVLCKLLQIYDSPQNLVILVNASPEEASAVGEELGILGCRHPGLRIVGFETGKKERQELYKKGGLLAVTSQILTVDMLTSDIPTQLVTGLVMLHAERVSPSSSEAFIARLYREKNKKGFFKAFSDEPEHITSGLSPLRTIMKELQLRTVHIYPRFHQEVSESLGRDRSVLQLSISMTESMSEIHGAIVQCMTTTLAELKRSNTSLDLDDLNVENAYFRSFDAIVRRQLDPVWHKVGPKTKQLVSDLATLRRLLQLLLTEDALSFQQYLESLIDSNTVNEAGNARQNQSPWMLTDAAHIIFQYARRRCYTIDSNAAAAAQSVDELDDEDAWEALRELEGGFVAKPKNDGVRPRWLPKGMDPVLEELPKWNLVADALQEIEDEMMRREGSLTSRDPGTNTILIMTSSVRTAELLREFLDSIDPNKPPGQQGLRMMRAKLRAYLARQAQRKLAKTSSGGPPPGFQPVTKTVGSGAAGRSAAKEDDGVSAALRKKDLDREAKRASRRRVRGGAPVVQSSRETPAPGGGAAANDDEIDIDTLQLLQDSVIELPPEVLFGEDFDANYGLVAPEEAVIVRAYSDDSDDRVLAEIQPRYIIMFEPNLEFVRRVEVYKRSVPGLGVRVYLMIYNLSFEEAKYLSGVRKEKDAFERIIKERGSMLNPILEDRVAGGTNDNLIKTISTRIAGGRRTINSEPSRVVVDMREFRSSLPSLLHAAEILVVPATLTVGDYVLTPDICIERKSIPDLISSFNSGRLYTQCEMMSAHYKYPMLLIEWEEHKSFSLDAVADAKSYAKPNGRFAAKQKQNAASEATTAVHAIQAKLVLLTLTFPRVRIIWSSSPFATADIFKDLKTNNAEPDPHKAIAIGAEEDPEAGAGMNTAAEELLRTLPGISAKNSKHVMTRVKSVRELCELNLPQVQDILGVEPGKACYDFIHRGDRTKPS
ncbi:hypothetical protein EIP86_006025 [Pleurotus ostreatoroseus]|nr:hypothetical protein EIP86_006025 [Pleurotus ostreatoroseus]